MMTTTNHTSPSGEDAANGATSDTGNAEADRIINRLSSSDPEFDDCIDAVAFIRKLVAEHKGPEGFATWNDAAVWERQRRLAAEKSLRDTSKELICAVAEQSVDQVAANVAIGEREAFEAWYRKEIHDATMFRRDVKGSTRYGEYCQWFHEESWKAWQARAALPAEKVAAEPLKDLALNLARETFIMNKIDVPRVIEKIDEALRSDPQPAQTQVALTDAPRYREWLHLTQVGMWTAGVPTWARDHDGRMNDGIAMRSVIEELAALLAAQPVSGGNRD
jgi:hypothetical protein